MYEKLYAAITDADAEMAICNYAWVNEDGSLCDKDLTAGKITARVLTRDEAFAALIDRCGVTHVTAFNKLYKYSLLNAVRFPEGKIHEDEFTVHHYFAHCEKIACVSDVLYFYVQREGSIMANFGLKNFDGADACLDRYKFFKTRGYPLLAARTFSNGALGLLGRITKIRDGKMFFRWLGLMFKFVFLLLISPKMWLYMAKQFIGKTLRFVKRYLAWQNVKAGIRKTSGQRAFLMATPEHGSLGDQAIVYAERQILERNGLSGKIVEVPDSVYLKYAKLIQQLHRTEDLIIIDGGGNFDTLWENEDDKIADIIFRFKDNKIIVFPQTCFYGNDSETRLIRNKAIYAAAPNLTLTFRDKASFDFAKANFTGTRCEYLPDIVLGIKGAPNSKERDGVLLCFRKDIEKVVNNGVIDEIKAYLNANNIPYKETDTVISRCVSAGSRNAALRKKWTEFGGGGLVITDRLHGMIFAAITGTPCVAVDNISKKVSGVYAWLAGLPYIRVLDNHSDIVDNIPKMYGKTGFEYVFEYPSFFDDEIKIWQT
jgi:pyruvyl transferase EpsI